MEYNNVVIPYLAAHVDWYSHNDNWNGDASD